MHPKRLKAITDRVYKVAKNVTEAGAPGWRRKKTFFVNGVRVALTDDTLSNYEGLVEELLEKDGWAEKYSESYLDKCLQKIVARAVEAGQKQAVLDDLVELADAYEAYSQEQIVYIPLSGIRAEEDVDVELGRVVMREMTPQEACRIYTIMKDICVSGPTPTSVQRSAKTRIWESLSDLIGTVCAEFWVVAEPTRARERALEETRRVVDLIRFAIPALYHEKQRVLVGVQGETPDSVLRTIPVLASDHRAYSLQQDRAGPLLPFQLNADNLERMKEIGAFEVSRLLQKQRLNDFENAILRGMHWMADATVQPDNEGAFLSLMTCLEAFLTPRDQNPIGTAIAEGAAIILREGYEARKQLKAEVKRYYGKRSGISHGGNKVVLDTELARLRQIAGSLTVWMVHHRDEFDSTRALLEWIDRQKLS